MYYNIIIIYVFCIQNNKILSIKNILYEINLYLYLQNNKRVDLDLEKIIITYYSFILK